MKTLREIISEMTHTNGYRDYFAGFDLRTLDGISIVSSIEASLDRNPLFAYAVPVNAPIFQTNFLTMIHADGSFPQIIEDVGLALEQELSVLPVGISHRLADPTSTVRFGSSQFYGNWFNFTSTDRAAYLRGGRKFGGILEAELNVSNRKKKVMAILLDRSHQTLDPVFPLERAAGCFVNTCGSFAPTLFIRSGVPIVSPVYLTPTTTLVSLTLQRFLGLGNVESVRLTQLSARGVAIDIPIILLHDVVLGYGEISAYMAIISEMGPVFFSLF